ncbi:hypothetical protein PHYBOEH_011416 [Phytophthora boehmeriae]|uniref:Protein HIRA n=1 Tax=Phytophthora boehmeriae TaxID=109152 RepID=A0A8T1X2J4_9STRA|nr:hypothetical protein PHYBOEH_011416 [Phytophthora boehmeriae]
MLLEKPEDVKHENASGTVCAIYGVDAHPTLQLFATAGGDNTVKIWSLQPPAEGAGIATFELMATLAFHQQAVNCVRWAGHGRYLASGSDDQLVLLYKLQEGAPAPVPFGSNAVPNKQNWVRCSSLERHTMDVEDLAWSPDDRMLATCSIDNTILIWGVGIGGLSEVMTQPLQTLTGHSGWVKGVAWDPVGKYLSSAGEDKTVRMWKVADWQESDAVSEPFEACASTSHFRRLSWSPDGSVLCATHAFSSKKNIAALLNRGTWTNDLKFVGHQGVVTCTRFNPRLLVSVADPEKNFACCAVGGEDATFGGDEIGTPISEAQQSKLLQAKYGSRAGITLASTLVENPIQLQLEEKSIASPRVAVSRNIGGSISSSTIHTTNTLIPKKKTKLNTHASSTPQNRPPSGVDKKRISPVLLQSDAQPSASNPASSHNNIRNILGPTIVSPTASDVTLLDARMTSTTKNEKELGAVPETIMDADCFRASVPLGSSISVMECSAGSSPYLLVILVTGELKIWDLAARKLVLSTSIEAMTNLTMEEQHKLTLLRCQVTTKGMPLVTFAESNSEVKGNSSLLSYTFDTAMSSWMRVADDSFVFSDFTSALPTDAVAAKSVPVGSLRRLQNASAYGRTQRGIALAMLSGMSDPVMQRNVTRSHLEHQVAAAIVLKSPVEYRYWVQAYARFLTHDEDVTRLDDLCAEMMGPFHASSRTVEASLTQDEDSTWNPMVLDLVKRDVLKLYILPTIATNRTLQRVVTKYQLMLSEIEVREKESE